MSKDAINKSRHEQESLILSVEQEKLKQASVQFLEEDNLKHVDGKIVVKVDMLSKNSYRFSDGTEIRVERQFNEFNRRIAQPTNAVVISGEGIPKGSKILIYHNALHETNRINDYKNSYESEDSHQIRYFSIPEYECYAWMDDNKIYHPTKGFQFGLRVYKPYDGIMVGIEPTVIKDVVFVTTGSLSGNVCHCLKSSDYQIIFQDEDTGKENYLIRFRHSDNEEIEREELIAVNHELTEKVLNQELLIGYTASTAKPFQINAYAD